jgi:hypothetical protein
MEWPKQADSVAALPYDSRALAYRKPRPKGRAAVSQEWISAQTALPRLRRYERRLRDLPT